MTDRQLIPGVGLYFRTPETAKLQNNPQSGLKMCFEISFFKYAAQLDKWALEDRQVFLVSLRIVASK